MEPGPNVKNSSTAGASSKSGRGKASACSAMRSALAASLSGATGEVPAWPTADAALGDEVVGVVAGDDADTMESASMGTSLASSKSCCTAAVPADW